MSLKGYTGAGGGNPVLLRIIVSAVMITVIISSRAFAESVFLKDGSIIEGTVTGETDSVVKLRLNNKTVKEFPRTKVLRVSFDDAYKKVVYLKRNSGKTIEGHIVEENSAEYTVRENLDSPAEYKIEKKDIIAVSAQKFVTPGTYYALGLVPGVAQLYADRDAEGITFLSLSIASLGFAGYAFADFNKKHDAYKSVPRGSAQSEFDSKYDAYKKSATLLTISLGVFASIYAANWVDVVFFAAPDFSTGKTTAAGRVFYNLSLGEISRGVDGYCGNDNKANFSAGIRF